jgi:hypothetical protein
MKLRTLIVTVLVLALVSVGVYFASRPGAPADGDARINQPLVERAVVEQAARIRLSDAGKTVELSRKPDGSWEVPSYYDLPADFSKLSTFVGNLTDAKIDRLVTSTPERIARLEFKDTKITLLDQAGKELWTITLGKSAESGGRYVRYGTEQKAYLANFQAWLDSDPKNWADASLLNLKPEEMAKIEIPFPGGETVTVSRAKKEDPWTASPTPAGQALNTDKVASLLSSVGHIRFSNTNDLANPEVAAAHAHERKIKLTSFDGKTTSITLARKPEEKKLKPPVAAADGKSGPGALGSVADLAANKRAESKKGETPSTETKPAAPEFETIPAGPVYVAIENSDANASINALMKRRAFEVSDYVFTSLPQSAADLFKPATPAPATTAPAATVPPKK